MTVDAGDLRPVQGHDCWSGSNWCVVFSDRPAV